MSHHIYKEFCLVINMEKYSFHINEIEFLPFWATLCQHVALFPSALTRKPCNSSQSQLQSKTCRCS